MIWIVIIDIFFKFKRYLVLAYHLPLLIVHFKVVFMKSSEGWIGAPVKDELYNHVNVYIDMQYLINSGRDFGINMSPDVWEVVIVIWFEPHLLFILNIMQKNTNMNRLDILKIFLTMNKTFIILTLIYLCIWYHIPDNTGVNKFPGELGKTPPMY